MDRNRPVLRACAYMGYPFLALFLVGFWFIAGFVPPPDPLESADATAARYAQDAVWIRAGMMVATLGAVLTLPWTAAVAVQMRRTEGEPGVLTLVWVMASALFCLEFVYPLMFWMVTAFRPDGDPEVLQRFHDLSWISLLGVVGTAIAQAVALGIAILRDDRARPVYPRWFGYFCLWAAVLFSPASLIVFFKNGAFAWNGVMAWWVVLTVFALWILVLTALTSRAVASDPGDPPAPGPGGTEPTATDALRVEVDALRAELDALRAHRARD